MTADSLLSFEIAPAITRNAGVFNIINASYFIPADVAGMSASDPLLDLFRAPGRTASMNSDLPMATQDLRK